jgi:hypothetical protein
MNRAQDWAIVAGGTDADASQPLASDTTVQIGDRMFSLDAGADASRVLVDGQITGRAGSPGSGPRFVMSLGRGVSPPGEPVFNEYGELIGLMGGSLVPGTYELANLVRFRDELRGSPVVPISLFRAPADTAGTPIADARARGDLLAGIEGGKNIVHGGFARGISKTTPNPVDERHDFSATEKEFTVFISWVPQARVKGIAILRLYDDGNHVVVESKPGRIDIRPDNFALSNWKIQSPGRPGVYRADVMIDGVPFWRDFVRITE